MPSSMTGSSSFHVSSGSEKHLVACLRRSTVLSLLIAIGGVGLWHRALAAEPDQVQWPLGRWRVVERGWELEAPLQRLEIRRANQSGDAIVVAFDQDEKGQARVWGSARLDRQVAVSEAARWLLAEWTVGTNAVLLQL